MGTIAKDQNNPGDIKWGEFARAHGAVGPGRGGHAIFPDYATGRAALEALLHQSRSVGHTLRYLNSWYAEDPRWCEGVARFMQVDPDFYVITDQDVPRLADAIGRQEGYGGPPNMDNTKHAVPLAAGGLGAALVEFLIHVNWAELVHSLFGGG